MPQYKLIIQKEFGSETWVNDYIFTATDLDDADSMAQPIIDAEVAIHAVGVHITYYRISTTAPDDDIFRNFPVNIACTHSGPGDMEPLFNVVRFDFPAASGRGGRKYLRGVLCEGDHVFDTLLPASITDYNATYAVPLRALGYLEKPNGVLLDDVVLYPKVGMRQLRRGSKRRVTPILP